MIEKFPSKGTSVLVTKDMCDLNNHMNVVYYQHIFEDGCHNFYQEMGFSNDYFNDGFSSFTLESNIRYLKELLEGERGTPYFRLIKINPKLIHYAGIIVDEAGNVSSFSEHVLAHVDMNVRKTSEMPDELVDSLNSMLEEHNSTGPIDFDLRLGIK